MIEIKEVFYRNLQESVFSSQYLFNVRFFCAFLFLNFFSCSPQILELLSCKLFDLERVGTNYSADMLELILTHLFIM